MAKYEVEITRIAWEQAETAAHAEASNHEFGSGNAEYNTGSIRKVTNG